ncbi:MAG: DivIVA domain-containing protein [Bacteroidota bacterium]
MKLSPLDIKRQQFGKAFRGYEPDEVDAFVKQVASQWESVLDELRISTERNRELEQKLKHYERVELALQEALETARETARRSEEAAERKAKIIVEQAELKADRTLQDVEQERFGLRRDIAKLTGRQNEVAARLRAFLMSELEILAQFQGDDPVGFIRLESASSQPAPEQLQAHEPSALGMGNDRDSVTELAPSEDLDAKPEPEERPDPVEIEPMETGSAEEPAAEEELPDALESDEAFSPVADMPAASFETPPLSVEEITSSEPPLEASTDATGPTSIDWDLPETVEPDLQSDTGSDWNLRTLVTGENESVAGSEAERERIRRILEDLD